MPDSFSEDFSWVMPGVLAATRCPLDACKAFEFFKDEDIDVIITLTESPLNKALIAEFGFEYHHIPVRDFCAPTAKQIDKFVDVVTKTRRSGKKVVVHCLAGRGRTGTMLACYMVSLGRSPDEALAEVRSLRPNSVETYEQECAVHRYARCLRRKRK